MVEKILKSPAGTQLDIRCSRALNPILLLVLLVAAAAVLCSSTTTASAHPGPPLQRAITGSESDSILQSMRSHNVHEWLPGRHARGWETGAPLAALKAASRWKEGLKIGSKPTVTWYNSSKEPSKTTLHRRFGSMTQGKPGWIRIDQCK